MSRRRRAVEHVEGDTGSPCKHMQYIKNRRGRGGKKALPPRSHPPEKVNQPNSAPPSPPPSSPRLASSSLPPSIPKPTSPPPNGATNHHHPISAAAGEVAGGTTRARTHARPPDLGKAGEDMSQASLSPSSSGDEEEEDEGVEGYRKGGYHAVRPGDQFAAGRYVAQRKLGWGNFSTVWLAFDVHTQVYTLPLPLLHDPRQDRASALRGAARRVPDPSLPPFLPQDRREIASRRRSSVEDLGLCRSKWNSISAAAAISRVSLLGVPARGKGPMRCGQYIYGISF